MTDASIEQEIVAKGLTAPRVTPERIAQVITEEAYFTGVEAVVSRGGQVASNSPLQLLTFCVLILQNGFTVTGESACASPENFNAELGRKIARANAVAKIWPLEGYLLKQRLHDETTNRYTEEGASKVKVHNANDRALNVETLQGGSLVGKHTLYAQERSTFEVPTGGALFIADASHHAFVAEPPPADGSRSEPADEQATTHVAKPKKSSR